MSSAPDAPRLMRLDTLRALAALWVMSLHLCSMVSLDYIRPTSEWDAPLWTKIALWWAPFGNIGVNLFVVLSGVCIHLSSLKLRQSKVDSGFSFVDFLKRRFWRLWPCLAGMTVLAFLANYVFLALYRSAVLHEPEAWRETLQNVPALFRVLTLTQTFSFETMYAIIPTAWSLAMEAQLYVAYPLFLGIRSVLGLKGTCVFFAIWSVGVRFVMSKLGNDEHLVDPSILNWWPAWAFGACLVEAWHSNSFPRVFANTRVTLALGLAVYFSCSMLRVWLGNVYWLHCLWTLGSVLVVTTFLFAEDRGFWVERRLVAIGVVSYSLYLLHVPWFKFWKALGELFFPSQPWIWYVMFAAALPAAFVSYRLFEQPFLKRRARARSFGARVVRVSSSVE